MRFLNHILFLFIPLFFVSKCTVFKKGIPKEVTVAFTDTILSPHISTSGINTKYAEIVSAEEIGDLFLKNFIAEGRATSNIRLVFSEEAADFSLQLISLDITESTKTEKISDSGSPYNGQEVVLNTVECFVSFKLIDNKHKDRKLMHCSNSKTRSEKLKNNRDLGDLIFGTNKDRKEYRTKLLSDRICADLAEDVGRRIWVPITRRIAKNMK